MWDWLTWGHHPKLRARQLSEMVDKLLGAGPQAGEDPFALSEKELKRLCTAARWVLHTGASGCRVAVPAPAAQHPGAPAFSARRRPSSSASRCAAEPGCCPAGPALAQQRTHAAPHAPLPPGREALLKEPSLLEVSAPSQAVIVGDLHGQFTDLQRIFERLGRPGSDDKVWFFLGDYVDRGEHPAAQQPRPAAAPLSLQRHDPCLRAWCWQLRVWRGPGASWRRPLCAGGAATQARHQKAAPRPRPRVQVPWAWR